MPSRRELGKDRLDRLRHLIDRNTEAQVAYAVTSEGEMRAQVAKSNLERFLNSLEKRIPDAP